MLKGINGKMLRSKSEAMIEQALLYANIPYRYECKLELDNKILYPDFTMLHPEMKEKYYWEHMGMMDNPLGMGQITRVLEEKFGM